MKTKAKVKEKAKVKGEGMTWFCSFLREYSHQGPQDDGEAEWSKGYISNMSKCFCFTFAILLIYIGVTICDYCHIGTYLISGR